MASRALSPAAHRERSSSSRSRRCCRSVASSRSRSSPRPRSTARSKTATRPGSSRCSCSRSCSASSSSRSPTAAACARASSRPTVETELRDDFYEHLQRLEVGFHDRWQSGQLLSRASSDISLIRRFAGVRRDLPARDHRRGDRRSSSCCCSSTCRSRLLTIVDRDPRAAALPSLRTRLPRHRPRHPGPDRRPHDDDRGIGQGASASSRRSDAATRCSRATTRSAGELRRRELERVRDPHAASSGCSA